MIKTKDILKYKLLILTVGIVTGMGIIAQPIVQKYVDCDTICKSEKNDSNSEIPTSDQDNQKSASSVATLQAISTASHIDITPTDVDIEEIDVHENPAITTFAEIVGKAPQKLLKVLFNLIIAPNAP